MHYEADPRHAELISSSLGLGGASSVCTPGVKDSNEDEPQGKTPQQTVDHDEGPDDSSTDPSAQGRRDSDETYKISALSNIHVIITDKEETHEVPAYSSIYGRHPHHSSSPRTAPRLWLESMKIHTLA